MRILSRYVVWQFIKLFVGFLIAAPVLFVIMDITEKLDEYLNEGLTWPQVLMVELYEMPQYILWSFPIAALIATVFTVNGLARHSELVAAKAGGVSFHRLLMPIVAMAVLLTVGAFGVTELVPMAKTAQKEVRGGEPSTGFGFRNDFVYRAANGRIYAIRRLDTETNQIHGLTVEREGSKDVAAVHIVAEQANWQPEEGWTFYNGYVRYYWDQDRERSLRFATMQAPSFRETPEQLLARPREPEEMGYQELGSFIEVLERSGGRPLKLMVERAQKISLPVATLIIVLFAAPLAMSSHRGGAAYGVGVSLGITILYLMLFKVAGAAGEAGAITPIVAAWLPNAIFLLASGVLLARVKT